MKLNKSKLIVILGPTASGKTRLAVRLASVFNGEIVSADSRQVYRGMDIGTGKDLAEYKVKIPLTPFNKGGIKRIPYHLIDIISPKTEFSLAKYQKLAYRAIDDIISRGKTPILTGGTGLYIQAVVDGMPLLPAKPNLELRKKLEKWSIERLIKKIKKMDVNLDDEMLQGNKRRVIRYIEIMEDCKKPITALWKEQKKLQKYDCLFLGVLPKPIPSAGWRTPLKGEGNLAPQQIFRQQINKKIDKRAEEWFKEGLVEEVERLHKEGVSWKRLESFGLEYKFVSQYLQGKLEYDEMLSLLKISIHQFAKRQMTWFKRNKRIKWVSGYGEVKKLVREFLKNK